MSRRGNVNKRKKDGDMSVFGKCEDLIKYTLHITNDTDKFPKKIRFTITNRIQNYVLELYDSLLDANEIYPQDAEDTRERLRIRRRSLALCKKILFFIKLSFEENRISDKTCDHWKNLVMNVKNMTAALYKSDKERFKV